MPLLSINIPAKLNLFMSAIINIATFDIVPKVDELY
jgi:hypothetical protein